MVDISNILKLPIDERLKIVEIIWDSIADDPIGPPLTDAQRQELDRRLEDIERNPDDCMSWEDFRARIDEELAKNSRAD